MRLDILVGGDSDDWQAVYIDKRLDHQGHDIPVWVWADLVKLPIEEVHMWEVEFCGPGEALLNFDDMAEYMIGQM
jgi:hypothetical protein